MNDTGMAINTDGEDYIDQLGYLLPLQRSLTSLERVLILFIASIFVSIVGCTLLCLICPRSPLRRKYYSKNKLNQEKNNLVNTTKANLVIVPPSPPSYESIVTAENTIDLTKLSKSPYSHIIRKSSNGALSDGDGIISHDKNTLERKAHRSQSARSSLSNGGTLHAINNNYLSGPYAQINVELEINILDNFLDVHLTNGEHFLRHPAFDEPNEHFIHVKLLNNKMFKKFYDEQKKRRSSLPLNTWKKQQEKATKALLRTSNDALVCNEHMQFQLNRNDIPLTSVRFQLICMDRSGLKDLMFETLLPLNPTMIPKYQQIVEFKTLPQANFGELSLGISYLPTAERFTINTYKLRYLCKIEKDKTIDARITITLFHNGRRFFQKKIPVSLNGSTSTDYEIKDSITENIPQNDIHSVYAHVEFNSKDDACISSASVLLGNCTRYETDWHKMLEYPRQTHQRWYPLLG
ncbi:unnamed protein product [Rotaria magnacalcarata]|uniref:Uncharacterized protein n=2 Tax=Rotaria magnacalcarata TaxID=392030 RepID=A0A816PBW6_9BILA|nr:unnamed protein product [Rotaria magnacalcarata]CAF3771307.1 unnamed protein product [Rotaria magnacalcarata]